MSKLSDWVEIWFKEEEERTSITENDICTFGLKMLDDPLGGLLRHDMCVIGADSGIGKTELSINIALHNAERGKKVVLYSLEGGAKQAIARIKWNKMCRKYYEKYKNGTTIDMRAWQMNRHENSAMMSQIENECLMDMNKEMLTNLYIYDSETVPTLADFMQSLNCFIAEKDQETPETYDFKRLIGEKHNVDLIIIDHLHYFSLTSSNEYQETSEIVKKIKDITNTYNIPVILISHLRKKDKERGLPNQEDFHGTSNISKVASLAITIAPCPIGEDHSLGVYPTWFRICKARTGRMSNLATQCNFNTRTNQYDQHYRVFTLAMDNPKEELIGDRMPRWAKQYENLNRAINAAPALQSAGI